MLLRRLRRLPTWLAWRALIGWVFDGARRLRPRDRRLEPPERPALVDPDRHGRHPGAHIRYWSTWDKGEPTPHATSNGTPWVNNCIPNCAQGKESSHHLVVTLSAVRTHNGVRYYSRMTWYTPGYRLYGYRTSTAVLHDSATRDTVPYWH